MIYYTHRRDAHREKTYTKLYERISKIRKNKLFSFSTCVAKIVKLNSFVFSL